MRSCSCARFYHGRVRRGAAWDCGFPAQTARMQDTAEGFGQPIRHIFEPFFQIEREVPHAVRPRIRVTTSRTEDRLWYCAVSAGRSRSTETLVGMDRPAAARAHHIYLIYSFVTLIVLLVFVR